MVETDSRGREEPTWWIYTLKQGGDMIRREAKTSEAVLSWGDTFGGNVAYLVDRTPKVGPRFKPESPSFPQFFKLTIVASSPNKKRWDGVLKETGYGILALPSWTERVDLDALWKLVDRERQRRNLKPIPKEQRQIFEETCGHNARLMKQATGKAKLCGSRVTPS